MMVAAREGEARRERRTNERSEDFIVGIASAFPMSISLSFYTSTWGPDPAASGS